MNRLARIQGGGRAAGAERSVGGGGAAGQRIQNQVLDARLIDREWLRTRKGSKDCKMLFALSAPPAMQLDRVT
jgi:hypothetical protein